MREQTVLIVDDEAIIRRALQNDLEKEKYVVSTASSGEEGLAALQDGRFDLVITDLSMPGIGGIQVLKKAKEIDPLICVIILTGFGDMASAIDALRLGADDYLIKPCDNDELVLRIKKCLQNRELQKKIKLYEDILSICSYCKKIRDDVGKEPGSGEWLQLESYLHKHTGVDLSHGLCPACYQKQIDKLEEFKENLDEEAK